MRLTTTDRKKLSIWLLVCVVGIAFTRGLITNVGSGQPLLDGVSLEGVSIVFAMGALVIGAIWVGGATWPRRAGTIALVGTAIALDLLSVHLLGWRHSSLVESAATFAIPLLLICIGGYAFWKVMRNEPLVDASAPNP